MEYEGGRPGLENEVNVNGESFRVTVAPTANAPAGRSADLKQAARRNLPSWEDG